MPFDFSKKIRRVPWKTRKSTVNGENFQALLVYVGVLFPYNPPIMKKILSLFLFCAVLSHSAWASGSYATVNPVQEMLLNALKWVGVPYQFGGNTEEGLDCSGFVRLVFKESVGKELPRTAREMGKVGENVALGDLSPGDLVFFNTLGRSFSHVGIYLGESYFLHAPRKGANVRVESMAKSYWQQRINGVRRVF